VQAARDRIIIWIAAFKVVKGSALVALGGLGLALGPQRLVDAAERHLARSIPGDA
jgi:hypothetical protein